MDERPAARLTGGLADLGVQVTARVFAVPGARSAGLRRQVDQALRWLPGVAVIVIGANDLTHRVQPLDAARDLGTAVRRLRDAGVEVVVAPAPDLSVVPDVPGRLRPLVRAGSSLLRSHQMEAVRAAGGCVADEDGATSSAFAADPSLFCGDSFHPSSAGYRVIADALLPVVRSAVNLPTAGQ
jgi:lysophospholipase L1-like esterase